MQLAQGKRSSTQQAHSRLHDEFEKPSDHSKFPPMQTRQVVALALSVRLLQALVVRTAFAPDEYWQSIEVAHRLVFGCVVQ